MSPLIKSISVVIPAYNEEGRILPTIRKIGDYLKERAEEFEMIVVDDGSSDHTAAIVLKESEKMRNLRLLINESNRGKGFSVRRGVLSSSCSLVLLSDADLSTPIQEVEKFLALIEDGFDIVIGSRALQGSDIIKKQPWYRQSMGRLFNVLVRAFVFGGFHDTQCGFKLFTSDSAKKVFGKAKISGFAFDVEALLLAREMGYRIKEVPVKWMNSPQSSVRVIRDSLRMLLDLLRIRLS